ncbi:MAG TPA: hypothetical protein VME21_05105 [Steroidobacteraceae bacterium]|nr:hypothetical protein [Steroidobacteraceae bacterium]
MACAVALAAVADFCGETATAVGAVALVSAALLEGAGDWEAHATSNADATIEIATCLLLDTELSFS